MNQTRLLATVLTGGEGSLTYPPMPVVVKTPACPVVVAPPGPGADGAWNVQMLENGVLREKRRS